MDQGGGGGEGGLRVWGISKPSRTQIDYSNNAQAQTSDTS